MFERRLVGMLAIVCSAACFNRSYMPPALQGSTLSATPAALPADGVTPGTVLAQLNSYGTPVAGATVRFTGDNDGLLLAPPSLSGGDGRASATMVCMRAGTYRVTAAVVSAEQSFPLPASATVTCLVAASPVYSSFVAAPTQVVADGSSKSVLTIALRDAQNVPMVGQQVGLAASGAGASLAQSNGLTDSLGIFSTTISSTSAQSTVVTAQVLNLTKTAEVTFLSHAVTATQSSIAVNPNAVLADLGSPTTVTVTARDAQGHPVQNVSVALNSNSASVQFSASSGVTSASGVFTSMAASNTASTTDITATLAGALQITAPVTFFAGLPNSASSNIVLSPSKVVANNVANANVVIYLGDIHNNPVPNQMVNMSATGTSNTFIPPSGPTDANGNFFTQERSTRAEAKTVTATTATAAPTATVTFVPGPPDPNRSTFTANPASVPADGVTQVTINLTAIDAFGNLISNAPVSLFDAGAGARFAAQNGNSDSSGKYSTTMTSHFYGQHTVVASLNAGSLKAPAAFTALTGFCSTGNTLVFTRHNTGVPSAPQAIAVADYNNDGNKDIAVATAGAGIYVLIGKGNATFTVSPLYPTAGTASINEAIAAADLNRDGFYDIVSAETTGTIIEVLLNNGDGTFASAVTYPASNAVTVTPGDFDRDGLIDIAVFNRPAAGTIVAQTYIGQGDGTLVLGPASAPMVGLYGGRAGDFNLDGNLDLTVADTSGNRAGILLGTGDGNFLAPVYTATQSGPHPIAVGDLNGDGNQDLLVTANAHGGGSGYGFDVLLGTGTATPSASLNYAAGREPYTPGVGDFNGDGFQDVVVASFFSGNMLVYPGKGDGTFGSIHGLSAGSSPAGSASGDFNNDNQDDIVNINYGSKSVDVFTYSSCN